MEGPRHAPNHRRPLETDTPAVDVDVLGEAHGLEHLGAEHATVSDLDPFLQLRVEGEDLQRGLHDEDEVSMCIC